MIKKRALKKTLYDVFVHARKLTTMIITKKKEEKSQKIETKILIIKS